jgi:hypothetical protein
MPLTPAGVPGARFVEPTGVSSRVLYGADHPGDDGPCAGH